MRVDPRRVRRADIDIEFETGERYQFGATTITQERHRRFAGAPLPALPGRTAVRRHRAAAHAVRARRQPVFRHGRSAARRARPREAHRARSASAPNRTAATAISSAWATAPTREVRGTVAWEDRRVNTRGHRFRTEVKRRRRSTQSLDARYIVPIGDPATEKFTLQLTGEHERLADIDDRSINFMPSLTHLRDSWFGEHCVATRHLRRAAAHRIRVRRVAAAQNTQTLLIPGISFALVPRNYLGEALFSRTLYAELRGSHNALGSDSDFLQVRVQAERVFDFATEVARAAARRHRRHRGVEHQRPRAVAALLRRRRPQRAWLRRQRPVARGTGQGRERRSAVQRGRQPDLRKGRRQTPVRGLGRAGPRPAEELRRRGVRATPATRSTTSAIR